MYRRIYRLRYQLSQLWLHVRPWTWHECDFCERRKPDAELVLFPHIGYNTCCQRCYEMVSAAEDSY